MKSVLTGCLVALAVMGGIGSASAELKNETLLTPLPEGFKIGFQAHKGAMDIAEYVPRAETVEAWSRMISVQVFHDVKNADPDVFADRVAKGWRSSCAGATVARATSGTENGYRFTVWIYGCPLNPATKQPESMFLKVIGGGDSLYSVQYAYRRALAKELTGPAVQYLRRVTVCDTRRAESPCP